LVTNGVIYSDAYFTIFGCTGDNGFVQKIFDCEEVKATENINVEKEILDLYFKKGNFKPRHRQLSQIKSELSNFDYKAISRTLHKLEAEGVIQLNGDLSFLTRQGISFYNDKYRNN
jgi:hypothetical protein